jgi:hypothetical protein
VLERVDLGHGELAGEGQRLAAHRLGLQARLAPGLVEGAGDFAVFVAHEVLSSASLEARSGSSISRSASRPAAAGPTPSRRTAASRTEQMCRSRSIRMLSSGFLGSPSDRQLLPVQPFEPFLEEMIEFKITQDIFGFEKVVVSIGLVFGEFESKIADGPIFLAMGPGFGFPFSLVEDLLFFDSEVVSNFLQ